MHGSTWVASSVVAFRRMSATARTSRRPKRGGHAVGVGEGHRRVAGERDEGPEVAGLDLVGHGRAGILAEAAGQLRAARRSGLGRLALAGVDAALVEPGEETRVAPHAAGSVEGPGDEHEGGGEPLGEVGVGAHRHARAREDRQATRPADSGDQSGEIVAPEAGDGGGVVGVVALHGDGELGGP